MAALLGTGGLTAQESGKWNETPTGPAKTLSFEATVGTWMSLAISPDGRSIAMDRQGGGLRPVSQQADNNVYRPVWSAEGRQVYGGTSGDGISGQVIAYAMAGGQQTLVEAGGGANLLLRILREARSVKMDEACPRRLADGQLDGWKRAPDGFYELIGRNHCGCVA